MKAIVTHWIGPTERRGSRIVATDEDGNRVCVPYRGDLRVVDAHAEAARALCAKMQWKGRLVAGGIKGGFAFVWTDSAPRIKV